VGSDNFLALDDARTIAHLAHAGQTDKLGRPYMEHVEAVAAGLLDFDLDIQVAGMLHDVVEDSELTLDDLRQRGVSERSLAAVELVSPNLHPELSYEEAIDRICTSADATLVKIADNAHNSRPDRVTALEAATGTPTNPRYARARQRLFTASRAT
jgi:(p)ppGpp synthase/HD superfamily hydrolase